MPVQLKSRLESELDGNQAGPSKAKTVPLASGTQRVYGSRAIFCFCKNN
jgi:hypothetical protein